MANSWGGLAAIALFIAWLAYYVPVRVGIREQVAGARTSDRFSGSLRVLAVAGGPDDAAPTVPPVHPPSVSLRSVGGTPEVRAALPSGRPTRRLALDGAARRAAARRRLLLTLALLVLTVVMVVGAIAGAVLWAVVLVPLVLLGAVLLLGRRAVLAGRRADEARFEAARSRAVEQRRAALGAPPLPRTGDHRRITGRAVRGSQGATQMIPRVTAADLERAARRAAPATAASSVPAAPHAPRPPVDAGRLALPAASSGATQRAAERPAQASAEAARATGASWNPVPVPPPTYALKPTAGKPPAPELPRPLAEPLPAPVDARDLESLAAPGTLSAGLGDQRAPAPVGGADEAEPVDRAGSGADGRADEPRPKTETLGLSLDAILARRRVAGE